MPSTTVEASSALEDIRSEALLRPEQRVSSTSARSFRRAVSDVQAVSIDVFDTALFRCVPEPADVFEIVAHRLRDAGTDVLPSDFKRARIDGESEARRRAWHESRCEEVTLAEIYAVVAKRVPWIDVPTTIACELDVERAVCVVNPDVKRWYDALVAAGIPVAFASDSYLPPAFVAELLARAGYTGAHVLAVSCDERKTKHHGSLFAVVAALLDVEPGDLAHLGDNRHADVVMARRAGVRPFWYRRTVRPLRSATWNETIGGKVLSRLEALARDDAAPDSDERLFRNLGYGVAGPLFLGLTQWLIRQVRAQPADLVLFCARDGYFVQVVYELLARFEPLPPARYFEVSRRALAVPSIERLDRPALQLLSGNKAPIALTEYFNRVGIDLNEYPAELAAAGFSIGDVVASRDQRKRIVELFELLEPVVLEHARTERPLVLEYLRQTGVFDASSLVMFDIGYGGSLQRALASLLRATGSAANLRAYYLSTDERIECLSPEAGSALAWFANAAQPQWMQSLVGPGYWLLEVCFGAQHGTVLGYRREPDGRVGVVHQDYDRETPNARAARSIQAAARELVERWIAIFAGSGPALPLDAAFERYKRFVVRPTREEATFFGDLVHVGGLGATEERNHIAKPPSVRDVLMRPAVLSASYRDTHWQVAYLQRLLRSNVAARAFLRLSPIAHRLGAGALRLLRGEDREVLQR